MIKQKNGANWNALDHLINDAEKWKRKQSPKYMNHVRKMSMDTKIAKPIESSNKIIFNKFKHEYDEAIMEVVGSDLKELNKNEFEAVMEKLGFAFKRTVAMYQQLD